MSARTPVHPDDLRDYFNLVKQQFDRHHYDPRLVATFDECLVKFGGTPRYVVVPRSSDEPAPVAHPTPQYQLTLGACIFANGDAPTSLVILPSRYLPDDIAANPARYDFCWAGQDAGRMTRQIFGSWVETFFIPLITERRAILLARNPTTPPASLPLQACLFVKGHDTHANVDALQKLRAADVDVITFPAPSARWCQPLQLGVFPHFRAQMKKTCSRIRATRRSEIRTALLDGAQDAIRGSTTRVQVLKSWQQSGILPFDPAQVLPSSGSSPVPAPRPPRVRQNNRTNMNSCLLTSAAMMELLPTRKAKRQCTRREHPAGSTSTASETLSLSD